MGRQTCLEITVFVWSNNFHELETFGSRKRILRKKNWRDVAVPEIVQSCFERPIHFPVFFPANYF